MTDNVSIGVGLLGLGTVGGGVASQLMADPGLFEERSAGPLRLAAVAESDSSKAEALGVPAELVSADASQVITNPDVDIVVEVIGGEEPAASLVLEALEHGKHVVTANKLLMATRGREILQKASRCRRLVLYGASVAGGIPVLRTIRSGLVATRVEFIMGILNGTTNFMLTMMNRDGLDYDSALAVAQQRGYAESDPTLDVNGTDAAQKISILSSSAFRRWVDWSTIYVEGIERVSAEDHQEAERLGYVIKLLAIARSVDGKLDVRVHPTLIPKEYLLASVQEAFNAVYMRGKTSGPLLLYGLGAGRWPTSCAVLGDVVTAARYQRGIRVESTGVEIDFTGEVEVVPIYDVLCHHFVRLRLGPATDALARITAVLAEHGIGIASLAHRQGREYGEGCEYVLLTTEEKELNMRQAASAIGTLDCVEAIHSIIRVEESRKLPREPEIPL